MDEFNLSLNASAASLRPLCGRSISDELNFSTTAYLVKCEDFEEILPRAIMESKKRDSKQAIEMLRQEAPRVGWQGEIVNQINL